MSLSSNTLFHFTNSFETIKSILKNGFYISYCEESKNVIPMVSFCDIPLSQARFHLTNYGNYVIGMNQKGGIKNKLNPVLYFEPDSHISNLSNEIDDILKNEIDDITYNFLSKIKSEPNSEKLIEIVHMFIRLLEFKIEVSRLTKPYSGELHTSKINLDNYKFYDEREWRYIPPKEVGKFELGMSFEDYEVYKKSHSKPHFKENSLTFKAKDVQYIIVKDEKDVIELMDFLMKTDNLGSSNDVRLLFTKILTMNQILEDI